MGFTAGATKGESKQTIPKKIQSQCIAPCSICCNDYYCVATAGVLWKFIVGSIIMILGLPIFGVTGASLYSKLLPPSIQGNFHTNNYVTIMCTNTLS